MLKITATEAEQKIIEVVKKVASDMQVGMNVDADCIPGNLIASYALVTAISRIADAINAIVPDNCYIFHERKTKRQLSIKEAALKLIKAGKNV